MQITFKSKTILIMSLVILLSSSSFFLSDYLENKLQTNNFSDAQLAFAEKISIIKAFEIKQAQQEKGSKDWFFYTVKLAKFKGKVAFALAQIYLPIESNTRREDISQAKIEKGVFWYQQAIRLSFEPAKIALAQWYFSQNNLNKAIEIIDSILLETPEVAVLKAKILIKKGVGTNKEQKSLSKQLSWLAKSEQGNLLIKDIKHFQILPNLNNEQINAINESLVTPKCNVSIQFFATSVDNLHKTERLIQAFKSHLLNDFVCFSAVRYRSIKSLQCSSDPNAAIYCNDLQWLNIANSITTRYVGVMLPKGGANVHLGMIFIDSQDTSDVLAHEISHLLGFVDEYPLPLNHKKCQKTQNSAFSENIAVLKKMYLGEKAEVRAKVLKQLAWAKNIKSTTPILHQKNNDEVDKYTWWLGTPSKYNDQVGVFKSESCDYSNQQAFKPVLHQTQLRYFEKTFPNLYKDIFNETGNQFLMPSFHYNLALALINNGDAALSKRWLKKAAIFEQKSRRKNKILTATF